MARRIAEVFVLSVAELGELFGVPEQTAAGWLTTGIPAEQRAKVAGVLAIANLLTRYLKADRISAIARRPAEAYGGRTMLQIIAAGDHEELLRSVRALVDFGGVA